MKPLKTEVEFATPWFQILAKTMREGEPPYYSLKLPDYTSIVALTDDQQILIVRQYRPAVERYTLELPSGLVDPGETPRNRPSRTARETGYDAANVEDLGPSARYRPARQPHLHLRRHRPSPRPRRTPERASGPPLVAPELTRATKARSITRSTSPAS